MAADLIILAFFFLLRVGEYTPHPPGQQRLTIPLRKQDIKLWRGTRLLSNDAPLAELLLADAVTICIANQKNGVKNAVLHHTTSGDPLFDPVKSAARLIHELRHKPATIPLGTHTAEDGPLRQVSAATIRATVRLGAANDNLEAVGCDLSRIGSHSLRSGGAVNLKLCGYDDDMVKKLGRWSVTGTTCLLHVQSQIANLTVGVAASMSATLRFQNVGA